MKKESYGWKFWGALAVVLAVFQAFDTFVEMRARRVFRNEMESMFQQKYENTWGRSKYRHEHTHELLGVLLRELRELREEVRQR